MPRRGFLAGAVGFAGAGLLGSALPAHAAGKASSGAGARTAQAAASVSAPFGAPTPADPNPGANITAVRGDRGDSQWSEQTRSEVLARHGVVATSQSIAAQAGLQMLQQGGSAADAAIATAAMLGVVEPESTGLGADMFSIYYSAADRKLYGINASGWSSSAWTLAYFNGRGYDESTGMPQSGVDTITVPGAVDGWSRLHKRFGNMTFADVLEPAARTAEQGFGVTERIHEQWQSSVSKLSKDPDSTKTFLVDGQAPALYGNFRNPDLAGALRLLQQRGRDAYYLGDIGEAIVAKIQQSGGQMSLADVRDFEAEWVDPISTNYRGFDVYELPPNCQGFAVLEMMNILEVCIPKLGYDLAELGPRSPRFWHFLVEAKKLAYADLNTYNGDPRFSEVPIERLTSKDYAATLTSKIDPDHASEPAVRVSNDSDTVYLTAADRWGNMVSFIYSIYSNFGSGLTVPGYGFPLQNRGALFSLDPASPNVVEPRKRPFHTIIPGFVMKDGAPVLAFGNMGGSEQPQAQATELVDMIDLGMNVQAAGDAARFSHDQASNRLDLESNLYELVGSQLTSMGHDAHSADGEPMGGYQAILFTPIPGAKAPPGRSIAGDPPVNGVYRAGTDFRKDGEAVGW
ncbi:MAG: gamma-glutamyltransferase [Acidothermales bacterium]|nr:gamma-glutamyltransferase [Acidothermales bacterium]